MRWGISKTEWRREVEVSFEFVDNMSFMNELCLKLVQY